MRSLRFAIVALAVATFGQQPAEVKPQSRHPEAAKLRETCAIEGRVLNAVTGDPVKKASVVIFQTEQSPPTGYSTTTTNGGVFVFADIEPGKYQINVSRSGYASRYRGGWSGSTIVALDPGQHLRDVVFRLHPQAVITGRVLDEDGEPVPRVHVQLVRFSYFRGVRRLGTMNDAETNDLGEYRLYGLEPGRYWLAAIYTQRPSRSASDGEQSYVPTYYPGTIELAAATRFELQNGTQLRGMDVTMIKTRTVCLRGRLIYPNTGKPVPDAYILLTRRNALGGVMPNFMPSVDAQGNFEVHGVMPGAYFLDAEWSDDEGPHGARHPIDVGTNDINNIIVEANPGMDLKGRLRVEGRSDTAVTNMYIHLESSRPSSADIRGGEVKADGSFAMRHVLPDHYTIEVFGVPETYYIKSLHLGDEDVGQGLDLTHGESDSFEVVLNANGGQVEGVVLNADEQPAAGVVVALIPDEPRRRYANLYKEVTTDQYGRFTVKGIAPGAYKLFSWDRVEGGEYRDPDFLKPFESLGYGILIGEGSRESAQLKLIPTPQAW